MPPADLGGRRPLTDSEIGNAHQLNTAGEPASQVARDLGIYHASVQELVDASASV